jgi:GEVED domain
MTKQIPGLNFIKKIDRWFRKTSSTGDAQFTPLASPTSIFCNRKFIRIRRFFDRYQQSKSREIRHRWKWLQRLLAGTAALIFALMPTVASANIAIVTGTGAILSALTGANVTLSNLVTSQGTPNNSIATFTGGLTGGTPNIGIDTGVALVTGDTATAIGPNNSTGLTSGVNVVTSDPQIATLTASSAYDTTSITFDIIPYGNFLSIKFVFASEEYNEYVCSQFNDAMGIFVKTGAGAYQNIAKIGSSNLTINQVNIGAVGQYGSLTNASGCNLSNSAFFTNNPPSSPNLQYDGFTIPLESQIAVIPSTTYTIKIVVADISDSAYDSAVFVDKISSFNLDFGDAPDSYLTAPVSGTVQLPGSARHSTSLSSTAAIYLGANAPDTENTTNPATIGSVADNDDTTGSDDEDAFSSSDLFILAGATSYSIPNIPVHNGLASNARLMGWIDFNKNGTFDAIELASTTVAPGINTAALSWSGVPVSTAGTAYARFRITTDPAYFTAASPVGLAIDGEVEDYRVKFDAKANIGAKVILVKRITAIEQAGTTTWVRTKNPNEPAATATPLNTVVHNTPNDAATINWPAPTYLVGAVNAGKIQPGDELEYTIYYLNAQTQGASATSLKICDPIRGRQTYTAGSMKLLPGNASTPISLTDLATDTSIDRANTYGVAALPAVVPAPTDCNIGGSGSTVSSTARDNGGVVIQLTGTGATKQPDLLEIPGATSAGTPTTSYGWFRFTTKVDP